jgi:dTDP-4-amino-4,6-dideoxygalactose transaminase
MLAAYLCAQLEQWQTIQARRRQIWEKYDAALRDWATHNDVRQPFIPADRTQSYHMYYLLLPGLTQRQAFIARLKDQEILSVFHYLPLHFSDMGMRFGGKPGNCPVTERISDQLVRLPFFYNLTDEEQDRVIEAIISQPV